MVFLDITIVPCRAALDIHCCEDAHRILSAPVPGRKSPDTTTWYCFQKTVIPQQNLLKKKIVKKSAMAGLECGISQAIYLLPPNKPAVCPGCGSRVALWAWLEQKMHLSVELKCPQLDYMGIINFQVHSQTLTWELGKHFQSCQLVWWFCFFFWTAVAGIFEIFVTGQG